MSDWDSAQVKAKVSADEWQTRVDLAACYRAVAMMGWDDLVFTHITAKIPGVENHFLINPYGLMFEEMTASSLVKIDLQGNKLDDNPHPINPAGFVIHSAIHAAREDAKCVLHVHSLNGVAVSAQKNGVLPISQAIIDGALEQARQVTKGLGGRLAWPGLLRRLDRRFPGYDQ